VAKPDRGIYKRNDGRYEVRYIKSRTLEGKAIYASLYASSYEEARQKRDSVTLDISNKCDPRLQMTIPEVLLQYLEEIKTKVKPSTRARYMGYLERRISCYFAGIPCADLNTGMIQRFVKEQIGLSPRTLESILFFMRKGLGTLFPGDYEIRSSEKGVKGIEILTPDEQNRLEAVAKCSDVNDLTGVTLSLHTGIKVGELCGLMWVDVDFIGRRISIQRTAQRVKNLDSECEAKTGLVILPVNSTSQRSIPLADVTLQMLEEHKEQTSSEYILSTYDSYAVEPRNYQYRFQRLLETAGIRSLPCQVTRDTFVARALEKGFDLLSLSEILGHSSTAVTLKQYAPLLEKYRHVDMDALAE
jgi:integrase